MCGGEKTGMGQYGPLSSREIKEIEKSREYESRKFNDERLEDFILAMKREEFHVNYLVALCKPGVLHGLIPMLRDL